jgi:hypothetical protein
LGKKGGVQPGSGRPRGSLNKSTLEQRKVLEAFNQRVMAKADALFNAQLTLAVGSMKVFRVDEVEGDNGKKKREHVQVTDSEEIKALLDEHDGAPGVVDGVYYYFQEVAPDNKAIEAMLNRALGKAVEKIEISKPAEAAKDAVQTILTETGMSEERARAIVAARFGIPEQELISAEVM